MSEWVSGWVSNAHLASVFAVLNDSRVAEEGRLGLAAACGVAELASLANEIAESAELGKVGA